MTFPPIDRIYWGVGANSGRGKTRPEQFVRELTEAGIISEGAERLSHGKRDSSGKLNRAAFWPMIEETPGHGKAVLSPVFLGRPVSDLVWIDLYDDWSLAPDINPYHRRLASRGYRNLSRGRFRSALITVNSRYMQDRLLPRQSHLIPNGIDSRLLDMELGSSSCTRLIIAGHFFAGRTDFALIREFAMRPEFSQIVVCGPGTTKVMAGVLEELERTLGAKLVIHDWLEASELASLAGPKTVALIPNLVRDYTVSQDLIKAGQMLALGVKVICPRLLWPDHLPKSHALLLDHGLNLDETLAEWIEMPGPDLAERQTLVRYNSWRHRAETIASLLEIERGC